MKKNNFVGNLASSVLLIGLTCGTVASENTSIAIKPVDTYVESHYDVTNNYKNESASFVNMDSFQNNSMLLKNFNSPKIEWTSKTFNPSKKMLKLELEAKALFGEMREATSEEQKAIQDSIRKISKPTGFNFWDYA